MAGNIKEDPFKGSQDCGFEGVGKRPTICPNNPLRNPDGFYRPEVCLACPIDEDAWNKQVQLPEQYKKIKLQQRQTIVRFPFPKKST